MSNKEIYRKLCKQQPEIPVFVKDWYLDAVCENGVWDVAIVRKGEQIQAFLPYFLKKKGPFSYITMPLFVKWMGPYFLNKPKTLQEEHQLVETLIKQLPTIDGIKQNFHYQITNWLPFYWRDYQQNTYYTYQLYLDNLDEVYERCNRNIRRNIKKAENNLRIVHDLSIETFYQYNKMSFDRQGLKMPYSFAQFYKHDKALAKHNARQVFFAVDEQDKIHSVAYLIWDGRSSYYHLSGDDPNLRQSGAGIFLIWKAIQYTKEVLSLNLFDFEGSMIKSVEQIRRQFGAQQRPYFYVWKYHSKWYKLLDSIKKTPS